MERVVLRVEGACRWVQPFSAEKIAPTNHDLLYFFPQQSFFFILGIKMRGFAGSTPASLGS